MLSRKELLKSMLLAGASTALPIRGLAAQGPSAEITVEDLKAMEKIVGIQFTDEERKSLLREVRQKLSGYKAIRDTQINYTDEPRTIFTPVGGGSSDRAKVTASPSVSKLDINRLSDADIAFLSVTELGQLIRTKKLSPVRLTEIYLARLKTFGDKLLCVVNLTEERARREALEAEREIHSGHYRGALHGIPYGVKDLFAAKGAPTTWGANVFAERVFDYDAAVVEKLAKAGAILLGKLSNGTFALGDVWFKGTTKNPFNPKQGSSGSSAGSASATAAGLVGFAIGTETLGSIISPSTRCRVTGLRPTYGRTSRYGGMALSYTMDKVGPICRSAEDTALVLAAICGSDVRDPSAVDRDLVWPPAEKINNMRIGYLVGPREDSVAASRNPAVVALKKMGAHVAPAKFTPPTNGLLEILNVESASAFDEFSRGDLIRQLNDSPWKETFRAARYTPAVEYLQAQRERARMMQRFQQERDEFDVIIADNIGGLLLTITNLTGTPQITIPWGDDGNGNSISKSLIGRNYKEARLCAVAKLLQNTADYHRRRPDLSRF